MSIIRILFSEYIFNPKLRCTLDWTTFHTFDFGISVVILSAVCFIAVFFAGRRFACPLNIHLLGNSCSLGLRYAF